MIFPEALYELSPRDRNVTWLDPLVLHLDNGGGAAAGSQELVVEIPEGRVLMLHSACMAVRTLAVETTTLMLLQAQRFVGGVEFNLKQAFPGVTGRSQLDWQGEILIPSELRVRAFFSFSGVVQNKVIDFDLFGMLLPVGNIQRI